MARFPMMMGLLLVPAAAGAQGLPTDFIAAAVEVPAGAASMPSGQGTLAGESAGTLARPVWRSVRHGERTIRPLDDVRPAMSRGAIAARSPTVGG